MGLVFDPYDLSEEVTPDGISQAITEQKYLRALVMSFRLNEAQLIAKAVEAVPLADGTMKLCVEMLSVHCILRPVRTINHIESTLRQHD